MKKIISLLLVVAMLACGVAMTSCGDDKIIVKTNAYFAPFEYYDGDDIVGVDVDIMQKVGERMGKEVVFENTEFAAIIDMVKEGKVCDAGAAGITVTDERKEKVDFSIPYYTSVQYVIFKTDDATIETKNDQYIVWEALKGKTIGTQTDTTGWIYTDLEINGDGEYVGVLQDTDTKHSNFDNAQLATDAIGKSIDVVIIDELPAQFIVSKNSGYKCLPLYYSGADGEEDAPVEEQYAICVTKGNNELLNVINEVLEEMLVKDDSGKSQVEKLVMQHMGLSE